MLKIIENLYDLNVSSKNLEKNLFDNISKLLGTIVIIEQFPNMEQNAKISKFG